MMKVKLIKISAALLFINISLRFLLSIFFGETDFTFFHHVFFNMLWILASVGLFKIQKWGRVLTLCLSTYYFVLFAILLIMTLIDGRISDITPVRVQGFIIAVFFIVILNLKPVKTIFWNK